MDDISNLVTARDYDTLAARALQYSVELKKQIDKLKLTISGKSAAVPNNASTQTCVRNLTNREAMCRHRRRFLSGQTQGRS